MKTDREQKRARLGQHLPDFPGYSALNLGETDLQLRRLLAGEMEKVRDRLADCIAGGRVGHLRGEFAEALRASARLKERFLPTGEERRQTREISAGEEERLFDLDLALLERVAALHSPLDRVETAASAADLESSLALFTEGVAEAEELFRRRESLLQAQEESGGRA